jgi:hypothetical protein
MSRQTIRRSILMEYLPEDVVRVSVVPQSNCRDMTTYLVLKFVQAFEGGEGFPLLRSRWGKAKVTAMNGEMAGNEGEKNLFVGVSQGQVPISQFVVIHAAPSRLRCS